MIARAALALALLGLGIARTARAADTAPVSTGSVLPPGVWAIVDSHTITKEEVLAKAKLLPQNVPASLGPSVIFEGLIDETIARDALDRDGAGPSTVPDAEVQKVLEEQRAALKRMGEDLDARLKATGMTVAELEANVRTGLAVKNRLERDATDDALQAWFQAHALELAGQVRVTEILVTPHGDDTATFQKALSVLARVKADGSNMAALARSVSEDPNAPLDSGDSDFVTAGSTAVAPEVLDAAFALGKKGLVPKPVRSHQGYHVIYVTDTRFVDTPRFGPRREQVKQRFLSERASELRKEWRAAAHLELAPDAPKLLH